MQEALKDILEIQELDMQMIQLMRLKHQREDELKNLRMAEEALSKQAQSKEQEIVDVKLNIRLIEGELSELDEKFKKLEAQQHAVKKVEEFNALSHEMSQLERNRVAKQQRLTELQEKLSNEESNLETIQKILKDTIQNNKALNVEIYEAIENINSEGRKLKKERDAIVSRADPEVFRIYERLLKNKRDRVVVPIENRCCSGCHIMLTAQDENLVRKGERLVFCEHCSRIHYWQESPALEVATVAKPRRRRSTAVKA